MSITVDYNKESDIWTIEIEDEFHMDELSDRWAKMSFQFQHKQLVRLLMDFSKTKIFVDDLGTPIFSMFYETDVEMTIALVLHEGSPDIYSNMFPNKIKVYYSRNDALEWLRS